MEGLSLGKDYILYGTMKIAKDFIYIFRDVSVKTIITESSVGALMEYQGIPVCSKEDVVENITDTIIVCLQPGEARDEKISVLKKKYMHAVIQPCEDFFVRYDETIKIPEGCELYVWGTGRKARQLMDSHNLQKKPTTFIDSYKDEGLFYGVPVVKPNKILDWSNAFVIVAVADSKEIEAELLLHGLHKEKNFVDSATVVYNPAKMLREVFFSQDGYDFACDTMLNHLEIMMGGATRVCCTTFMKVNRVNFLEPDFMEYWSGKKDIIHRILALSTQNRSYVYCDKAMCPLFDGRKNLGAEDHQVVVAEYRDIEPYPKVVACGFDNTCNLACETCRKGLEVAKGRERQYINRIAMKVKEELLPNTEFLVMAGNGEVLLSPAYRSIWESEAAATPRFLRLLSNGLLFNEILWRRFSHGKENTNIMLTVSIDAAKKETYEDIRKFGNFDQLQHNMAFAGHLRREGKLAYFRMNFVVQRKNIHEMMDFASWGKKIGADKVFFTKILNWGTYEEKDFQKNVSVMEEDGVTPIPELKAVLESSLMHDPIVDLGTIRFLHQANIDDYVKNYYMWELEKDVPGVFR